jgi:hypothetical protein
MGASESAPVVFPFLELPRELQHLIIEHCDLFTLFALSCVSRGTKADAQVLLPADSCTMRKRMRPRVHPEDPLTPKQKQITRTVARELFRDRVPYPAWPIADVMSADVGFEGVFIAYAFLARPLVGCRAIWTGPTRVVWELVREDNILYPSYVTLCKQRLVTKEGTDLLMHSRA